MAKLKKHRMLATITVSVFFSLVILLSPLGNPVKAIYGEAHAITVFLRFVSEFLRKTPAGEYYLDLLMKHGEEQYWIVNNRPEHIDEFWQVVQMFTPGVEALVGGKGDSIRITQEQVDSLRKEWEWESQFASTTFREDVAKELERFPLNNFVGMTMSEAWNFINSNWKPDLAVEPTNSPVLECDTLSGLNCPLELSLVPNSNGLLSYYVLNGVYFEIPSTWSIQSQGEGQNWLYIYISPLPESPEKINFNSISMYAGSITVEAKEQLESGFPPAKWKLPVTLDDFQGVEFLWEDLYPSTYSPKPSHNNYLQVFLYNDKEQIAVGLIAGIKDFQTASQIDNPGAVGENFPNLQRIIESVRIWKP